MSARHSCPLPVRFPDGCPVATLPAEIDMANAGAVTDTLLALLNRGVPGVIADMSGTSFCDAAGIHAIMRAHGRAQALGTWLGVVVTHPSVRKIFRITRADTVVRIYATLGDAMSQPGTSGELTAAGAADGDTRLDPGRLKVTVERRGNLRVLCIGGHLDTYSSAGFAERVAQAADGLTGPVPLDLSGLAFIDCAGARALATALGEFRSGWVMVGPLRRPVRRLLDLTGLNLKEIRLQRGGAPQRQIAHLLPRSRAAIARSQELAGRVAATCDLMADVWTQLAARSPDNAAQRLTLSDAVREKALSYRRLAGRGARPAAALRNGDCTPVLRPAALSAGLTDRTSA